MAPDILALLIKFPSRKVIKTMSPELGDLIEESQSDNGVAIVVKKTRCTIVIQYVQYGVTCTYRYSHLSHLPVFAKGYKPQRSN